MNHKTEFFTHCKFHPSVGFFICILFLCSHYIMAQEFGREWMRYRHPLGDPKPAGLKHIVTDASGNSFVIGQIESATTGLNYLTIKYSPSGEKLWQREYDHLAEDGDDIANAVTVDDEGNVYVTGSVIDNTVDPGVVPRYTLTVKYDASGNQRWVRRFEDCTSSGSQVAVNQTNGDVIVAGYGECMVVICYDSDGNYRWQHDFETPGIYGGISKLLVDGTGNVYVTGRILIPYRPIGMEHSWAIRTMKFNADGENLWTKTVGEPVGLPPFNNCHSVDMAVGELEEVYLFIQRDDGSEVLRYTASESETLLTLPRHYHYPESSSMSIALLENDLYLSFFVDGLYHTQKYNVITRELLWANEDHFETSDETSNYPSMQIDELGNVYIVGPRAESYRIISYAPDGTEKWSIYEFPYPSDAGYSIQEFHVGGENKVYVVANRIRPVVNDYLVAKYAVLPPPVDDDRAAPIIPDRLREYERFVFGAYAPERDWCWTGIDIDWEINCTIAPELCEDYPVTFLTENGKIVWQEKFTKPTNFILPVDDKLPRQLSVAIPVGTSSQDVIMLDENLVHSGISGIQVSTYGDKNLLELKAETIQGKNVPFTMTLLNKEGKEIWQETFIAPLDKQIEAYVKEPGVALTFSALPDELQLSYFPNPFSESITVELAATKTSPAQVAVFSMQGEKILQEQVEITGPHSINMKYQKPGLYILVVNVKGNEVRKLVELKK
jgi:hypothetical protein